MSRIATLTGSLARAGFGDPAAAAAFLQSWEPGPADAARVERLVKAMSGSADPDLALAGFDRLASSLPDARRAG